MKKNYLRLFLILPFSFGGASIFIGLLRNYTATSIFDNTLGIVGVYYLIISIFVYIKWDFLIEKADKREER